MDAGKQKHYGINRKAIKPVLKARCEEIEGRAYEIEKGRNGDRRKNAGKCYEEQSITPSDVSETAM